MAGHTPEKFAKAVALVFKEARENAGLSQKRLSELSGVGRTGIVVIEQGRRIPSLLLCKMLADGLKVPLSTLVAEVENQLRCMSK